MEEKHGLFTLAHDRPTTCHQKNPCIQASSTTNERICTIPRDLLQGNKSLFKALSKTPSLAHRLSTYRFSIFLSSFLHKTEHCTINTITMAQRVCFRASPPMPARLFKLHTRSWPHSISAPNGTRIAVHNFSSTNALAKSLKTQQKGKQQLQKLREQQQGSKPERTAQPRAIDRKSVPSKVPPKQEQSVERTAQLQDPESQRTPPKAPRKPIPTSDEPWDMIRSEPQRDRIQADADYALARVHLKKAIDSVIKYCRHALGNAKNLNIPDNAMVELSQRVDKTSAAATQYLQAALRSVTPTVLAPRFVCSFNMLSSPPKC